ncbi:MAG: molybdate ABC transporter permease subunit [Gemmatimonadetes bacterium]|nr:molybdate ABC transporter permease subunit [Gemmatimonadota bacterium]
MTSRRWSDGVRMLSVLLAGALVACLALPVVVLVFSSTPSEVARGLRDPLFAPALGLSLRTTLISLTIIILTGTPLAWWLARSSGMGARALQLLVDLPIVIPPAVVGVALLQTFGRRGVFGPLLASVEISIPFTSVAVVLAQTIVAAPFYVQAAVNGFRNVDGDLLITARTLGAGRVGAFFRVALPMAVPGLVAGASLAWARALGEFGATLIFAGNLPGVTQTLPLAIFTALESDIGPALVFSLLLTAAGAVLLLGLRLAVRGPGRAPSRGPTRVHQGRGAP